MTSSVSKRSTKKLSTESTISTGTVAAADEFRCTLCNYSGRSQHCLTKHMRAHDVAYKICQYCRRAFERPSDLLRHEERHRKRDGCAVQTTTNTIQLEGVSRLDEYQSGERLTSQLMTVQLDRNDIHLIPDAGLLTSYQQLPPTSSKLRDVYHIMTQSLLTDHCQHSYLAQFNSVAKTRRRRRRRYQLKTIYHRPSIYHVIVHRN